MLQGHKQLDVTDEMLEQIRAVADSEVSADSIVVFEATALNSRPVSKAGSLFDGAVHPRSTLVEMAEKLNSKDQSVPLHTMHQQSDELPVGRVFYGYVQDTADGYTELRAQFYLPRSETQLIEKINLGLLDEVSVGLRTKQLLCSKCGFDYMSDEADFLNLWDQTCNNDHTIGVDGTHVVGTGVDKWMELSLVSRGAAFKAKIHGKALARHPSEATDKIAASGVSPDIVTLFASPTPTQRQKEDPSMTTKPEAQTPSAASEAEFDAKAAIEELGSKLDTLIETLTAQTEPATPAEPEVNADVEALQTQLSELSAQVEKLTGVEDRLQALLEGAPAGGVAADAVTDGTNPAPKRAFGAFKLK